MPVSALKPTGLYSQWVNSAGESRLETVIKRTGTRMHRRQVGQPSPPGAHTLWEQMGSRGIEMPVAVQVAVGRSPEHIRTR